jgi:hypothetical protein
LLIGEVVKVEKKPFLPLRFTVPKSQGQRNEDKFQHNSRKGICALSDGASVSFDSEHWSEILVRRFAQEPTFSAEWLANAIAQFTKKYDRDSLPWMKQAAFDRGSFASLLGVCLSDDGNAVEVLAIGDSLAVLCDGDKIKDTFPYREASQFDQRPQLLCTNPRENQFIFEEDFLSGCFIRWSFRGLEQPLLLCMTDALGQWLLSWNDSSHSPISILRKLETPKQFERFVHAERAAARMKKDDTTLLAIEEG